MKIKRQDTSIPVFSYVMDIFLFSHPLQLLITQHSLVQFFLHPVNEIGAAFVLPAFDISVEAVAVFRINPEYLIEKWGELFERHIAVVDAAHHVYAVDKFHEVDGIARPLKCITYGENAGKMAKERYLTPEAYAAEMIRLYGSRS